MTDEEKIKAEQNAIPQKPIKHELGGGFYYQCHWLTCRADLKKWWDYCPICGQKIDWRDYL